MARPKSFDETLVLEAAIDCFWSRGYEATSVRELAAEMGIGSASLYNAFGDKRTLFVKALERYLDGTVRERIERLETTLAPKDRVRSFIAEVIERSLTDTERRGCFLVNSALEVAPHDPSLGAEIAERLGEIEGFFRRSIQAAQREGAVPPERNARELARLFLAVLLGIRVLARAKPERRLLEDAARPALALLD